MVTVLELVQAERLIIGISAVDIVLGLGHVVQVQFIIVLIASLNIIHGVLDLGFFQVVSQDASRGIEILNIELISSNRR